MELVNIEGGTFLMGSPETETGRDDDETQHEVTLAGFALGKYPVTQAEYEAVRWRNPSSTRGARLPVTDVSWFDAAAFCNALSRAEGLEPCYTLKVGTAIWNREANGYRLPTEAEWEYACRAGTDTPYWTGRTITPEQAAFNLSEPAEVGGKPANSWGLFDMAGCVWEWCYDWKSTDYGKNAITNPIGSNGKEYWAHNYVRVNRGGGWNQSNNESETGVVCLRSAERDSDNPKTKRKILGFRVARNVR